MKKYPKLKLSIFGKFTKSINEQKIELEGEIQRRGFLDSVLVKIIFPESYPLNLPLFAIYENNKYKFIDLDPTMSIFSNSFKCYILSLTDRVYEPYFRQRDPSMPPSLWDLSFSSLCRILITYWFLPIFPAFYLNY